MQWVRKVLCFAGVMAIMGASAALAAQYEYPFQNPNLPTEQRITDLLLRMTLQEKVACLASRPVVPRLGVYGSGHIEGLHGVALGGPGGWEGKDKNGKPLQKLPTTQFPQARGLGNTWDPALIEQAAAEEGLEARYDFQSTQYDRGGIIVRAPNADLSRDPRWGRSEESYGEDPYLVGTLAVSFVKGLQGSDPHYWLTASLLKHFLANSNEDGRGGSSSNFDDRLFHEYYAVPFRMAIEQGGANAMMTAYNAWNHIPMAAQPALRAVVMRQWGFDGILCTDAGALTNMVTLHKYYPDMAHAAAGAIHAGINQFLDNYRQPVMDALREHLLTEADIDQNLRGVFRVMIHLGLLDPPSMVPYAQIGKSNNGVPPWELPATKALARKVTDESIVLLKNEHGALPLEKSKLRRIAVIGPYANIVALDWYSGTPPYAVSPLEGIRAKVGNGARVTFDTGNDVAAAVQDAKTADVAIVVVGNHPTCDAGWDVCKTPSNGKEAIDRKTIYLEQEALVKQVYAVNPRTVVVLISSFPYAIDWTEEHVPAIVHMTHNSEEEGNALADVLFGDYNPAGRLTQTWPRSMEQLPPMMDYNIRDGRTYMYFRAKPLYAFGYGKSYTKFAYSELNFSTKRLKYDGSVAVRVTVKNTGSRDGDEVVQMYIKHLGSKVVRPQEELKGFARINLKAGESRVVTMELRARGLAYWDDNKSRFVVEEEPVRVMVGSSSDDLRLQKTINVVR